jgi:uncharacterized protein (DUF934 family)
MPRRLLRDRQVVVDEWRYLAETADDAAAPLILTLAQWQMEPDTWLARGGRLGVLLSPAHQIDQIVSDLKHFALIALEFTGPGEGRGYSKARQLRDRWNFKGELRATGYVRRDQLFFMARCGFNSFEVSESDIEEVHGAFSTFSAAYQPSNDLGLAHKLRTAAQNRAAITADRAPE